VIVLHDNAPSHTEKTVKETIATFGWEILPHTAYLPDLAPSDFYLFASMRFTSYENVRTFLDDLLAAQEPQLFWSGIHTLPEQWQKCIASDGQSFE